MNERSRRILGTLFGLAMGLAYGLASQTINLIALPGVHLHPEGLGTVGSIIFITLTGGLMGLLAAWPDEAIPGVIMSAVFTAAVTTIASFLSVQASTVNVERVAGASAVLLITFFPRAFLFAPVAGLVRWALGVWDNQTREEMISLRKMALSVAVLLVIAIAAGALSLYPKDARYALKTTEELIQAGMGKSSRDELPEPLRPVDGFLQGARGPYTLLLSDNPDELPVQRPMTSYTVQEYAVFVNFEDGFRFGCAYTPPHPEPACGAY
jgi:uncharacterized membrane protein (UPF0136 family)